jgi:beta-carotene hydroxylase
MLLLAAYMLFSGAIFAFFNGDLSLSWIMTINSIASYMAFTVAHDATHSAVSSNRKINDWAGRSAILLLEPGPFFPVFRFIHMQHHRFTNDPVKDPDAYTGSGPAWLFPFKWLTLDVVYFKH